MSKLWLHLFRYTLILGIVLLLLELSGIKNSITIIRVE